MTARGATCGQRVLLVAGVPPCTNYSGGIFLDAVIRAAPSPPVAMIAVLNPALKPEISGDLAASIPLTTLVKPREWYDLPTWADDGDRIRAAERTVELNKLPPIVEAVDAVIEKHGVSDVWIVLEGQTLIRLAARLLERRDIRLRPHVTDPPGWGLSENRVDQTTHCEVLNDFERVLRGAAGIACASQAMADRYAGLYQSATIPLLPALPEGSCLSPATSDALSGPFRIGFAGQAYAGDEIRSLLDAVDSLNRFGRLGRIETHLTVINSEIPDATHRDHIVCHRPTDQQTLIERLSHMHLLYCPYWFDRRYREASDLCFPSKLVTYLATGRPVLFHGRRDASPAGFLVAHQAAFFSFSTDPLALQAAITRALGDADSWARVAAAGNRAFTAHFRYHTLARAFTRFIQECSVHKQS